MMKQAKRRTSAPTDQFYIQAASPQVDEINRVLKHGDTFVVCDHYGDIKPGGLGEEGLFHEGTRFLSTLLLQLGARRPLLLSSTVKNDNVLLVIDLTNPDISVDGRVLLPRGSLHLARTRFLWSAACHERISFRNYGMVPIETRCRLHFEADYADIFEVRGMKRERRGRYLDPVIEKSAIVLAYEGLDGVVRRTRLEFAAEPCELSASDAEFVVCLPPHREMELSVRVSCVVASGAALPLKYQQAFESADQALQSSKSTQCVIESSNEQFNNWVERTTADLHMMVSQTPAGPYPYAGVPWYNTAFGRDGVISALECLWLNPGLARGVLSFLASMQATEVSDKRDSEPGKILHETRGGEMAALEEIPFGRYYGSVDSTPLFVWLASAYYVRSGDLDFIRSIWPNIEKCLQWIDTYGDRDGDGLVEYQRQSRQGLVQQGWKDSSDSVFHADGTLAAAPIALSEVQGYVYAAKHGAALLATLLERVELAQELLAQAQVLQEQFDRAFWCEDLSTYALALDGEKQPCRVITSNAGHCLASGIAQRHRASRLAQTLLRDDSFSGWGIRTVCARELRYNPMSYHNGSIWPHDNALIAFGLSRYGLKQFVLPIFRGLFDASGFVELHRLPELFCGFGRRPGEGPTLYPVACAPQTWAACSVYLLLQAILGFHIDAPAARISFYHPLLPEFLKEITIRNLQVADAVVDLHLQRHRDDVGIEVLRREGNVSIVTVQ